MTQLHLPHLLTIVNQIETAQAPVITAWMDDASVSAIMTAHGIERDAFVAMYANDAFAYYMRVVKGETELGKCPLMVELLSFLKEKNVSAEELFLFCSGFRKAMLDFTYDAGLNTKELFHEISALFDRNFSALQRLYSDSIYNKEQEIVKNVNFFNEYKKAMDASSILSSTNGDGIITYVNDNFCRISGYARHELIGKKHNLIRHPDMPVEFFTELWTTIKAKNIFKGTIKNVRKNGDTFYIDTTIVPITNPFTKSTEYMAISYEVTKLINATKKAIDAGMAKDYFLSNMSHEIRTPLNAILGFVSLLQDDEQTTRQKKYLDIIHNSGENLLSIINDILDFSKLRSGEFTVDTRPFNLHEELSHTLELFVPGANDKQITIVSFIDPKIPYELVSDPLRIKQIISNFLSNAIKFTPRKGLISVEASYKNKKLYISVKDTGIGVSEADQEKIFNAFSQVGESNRVSGGTGLGLSICKQLAEHMGGSIRLESQLEKGSDFILTLPVKPNETGAMHMFDPTPFQKLRMALLSCSEVEMEKLQTLKRYWGAFNIDAVTVDALDEDAYDVLFFIDKEVDDDMRDAIKVQPLPSIAIMDDIDDKYEDEPNITPLYYPIYCSKLYNTFLEALQLTPKSDEKIVEPFRQRFFKGHVLIAEDNSANQELIKTILDRYGLSYYMTFDGQEALRTFKRASFDLVLMDEQMPVMNGLDATREMLAYEVKRRRAHTPIVALTANVIKGAKEHGMSAGYDAFLGKPIVMKELEQVFERFLEEAKGKKTKQVAAVKPVKGISGIDIAKLQSELMLDEEQLLMLIKTFLKKLGQLLPELKEAIEAENIETVGRLAHSLKGSSANFRIESLQKIAKAMEEAAYAKDKEYDYLGSYEELLEESGKIEVES